MNAKEKKTNLIGCMVFVAGVVMMVAGIWRGELSVVLTKAANICMQCIGIG